MSTSTHVYIFYIYIYLYRAAKEAGSSFNIISNNADGSWHRLNLVP